MSLTRHISWTFGSRVGAQASSILFSVFIARIVSPADYGLIGMLTVLTGFALTIGEGGVNSALIFLNRKDEEAMSTGFWLQFLINLFFMLIFFFASDAISRFYYSPNIAPITRVMSILFLIQTLSQVQTARLMQDMNFKAIGIVTFLATLGSSALALVLAIYDWGVWALVAQAITLGALTLVGTTFYTRWHPRLCFSFTVARQILGYSAYLLLNNSINYWLRNGDNLLIGRVLGARSLGLYNRAYSLMLLPLGNIGAILGQVMFPKLSQIRENREEFRSLYLKSLGYIAFVTFPIMGGLSVLSAPILLLLYGSQWVAAAPVLQVLSLVGLLQCIIFPVGWIYNALDQNRMQFTATLILTPIFLVLIVAGLRYGIMGVTWGYALWAVISALLNIRMAGRLINVSLSNYLLLLLPKASATLLMMLAVRATAPIIESNIGPIGALLVCMVLGAVTYFISLAAFRDDNLRELLTSGRRLMVKRG